MSIVRTKTLAWTALVLLVAGMARAESYSLLYQLPRGERGLQFNMVEGRVTFTCWQPINYQTSSNDGRRKEVLNVNNENGQPSLTYDCTTPEEHLKIEFSSANQRVLLRRTPQGKSSLVSVEYEQVAKENITLTLGSGTKTQVFRGPNIWQLLVIEPDACRQHLLPLLDVLRPNWRLAETAGLLEKSLLRVANSESGSDRAHWAALVEQLADASFAKRQAADRALRTGGGPAAAYLKQLDFSRLDAEQQFRVLAIIAALTPSDSVDSPDQVARSLAGEPAIWLALLSRPDVATRQTAARQLVALLGESIPVDPAADPDTQKVKREQLRVLIGVK
jgi:hypothetical protein